MSLRTELNKFIEKIETDLGKAGMFLDAHIVFVLGVENDLLKALENPSVDFMLSTVLPAEVISQIPNIETIIEKAIADELIGTKILADVNGAVGTEAKIRVLIADIKTTPGLNKGMLRDICLAILAALNNNALKAEVYGAYYAAKKALAA